MRTVACRPNSQEKKNPSGIARKEKVARGGAELWQGGKKKEPQQRGSRKGS